MDPDHDTTDYSDMDTEDTNFENLDNEGTTREHTEHDYVEGEESDYEGIKGEEIEGEHVKGNIGHTPSELSLKKSATSKAIASHNPAHTALFTAELLCDIISRLPFKSMIAITGVCRFWRNAAASDLAIQKAMFLAPDEICKMVIKNSRYRRSWLQEGADVPLHACMVKFHPILQKIRGSIKTFSDWVHLSTLTPTFDDPFATWRHMLVSQPPCKKVVIVNIDALRTNTILYNESGVRLEQIYDFLDEQDSGSAAKVRGLILKYKKENTPGLETNVIIPIMKGAFCHP